MKILLIDSAEFLTDTNPNEGSFTLDQAKILKKRYAVDILSPGIYSCKDILKKKKYKKFEIIDGIRIYRRYKKNLIPYSFSYLNPLISSSVSNISLELFKEYLKNNEIPDFIHAHKIRFSAFAAYAIYKKYKIPYIITEHNSDVIRNIFPNSLKKKTKIIIQNSLNFNTVSKLNSIKLKKYFNLKSVDILYNVLPEIFIKNSLKKNISKNNYNFLSVTRLDVNKNVKILIDAFIEEFRNSKAILNIVGGGTLVNKYKKYILTKKMSHKVKILGFLDRKVILRLYQKCNCFIITSHNETFCLSMMESLLFKNYCITSRHSGFYELKDKKISLPNFDSKNKSQLKRLMKKAYKKNIDFNYRNIILKYFGKENFLKKISRIYSI